jgi:beta-N-acetylhexosaminidase
LIAVGKPSASLDLRQQAGQLLILGFEGTELSAKLRTMLSTLQPGGIVLFARNIATPQQTWELLEECRNCLNVPPFLCVDMEGGSVDRFRDVIAPAPSAEEVAASGKRKLFRRHGQIVGDECRSLGFNVDFAPVCDLKCSASAKVMGTRTASADPDRVVEYARTFLRGLKEYGVLGCGKHFPGLGEGKLDTHHELPQVDKTMRKLWEEDLYPYRALQRSLPFVMVSHAAYPGATRENLPATLCRKLITGVLRKRIGYEGLVVTDDMDMGALLAASPIEEAAVETLRAGSDLFMICRDAERIWAGYEAVLKEAEHDRRFAQQVQEKSRRVLARKRRSREVQRHALCPTQETVDRLRRELWELGEEVRMAALAEE